MALEKPLITYRIENEGLVLGNAGKPCTNVAQFEKDNVLVTEEKLFFHHPASDRNVVKLLAFEKFNTMRTKQNNLTGVESATRRTFSFKGCVEEKDQSDRDAAEIAVKKQNEATQKSLDSTMAFGGFAKMGAMYLRVIKNAAGGTEQQ
ncbi:hypothetical protein CH379_019890, partial [Leptospira ellisii]